MFVIKGEFLMTSFFHSFVLLASLFLFQDYMCGSDQVLTFPCSFSLLFLNFFRQIEKIIIN